MSELSLRNRQRARRLDLRYFRQIAEPFLHRQVGDRPYEIAVFFVEAEEMARVNQTHLRHAGSTDVITFGYSEPDGSEPLTGDIFICIDEAVAQARAFDTSWPSEVVRYFIHAILHLRDYDDLQPAARRVMKREENRLVKKLSREFALGRLARRQPANS